MIGLAQKPLSPWAGVPFQPDDSQALQPAMQQPTALIPDKPVEAAPSRVFAPTPKVEDAAPAPVMNTEANHPFESREDFLNKRLQRNQWKDENPWGTANNHPGVVGKIGHVLGTVGRLAGEIFAPQLSRGAQEEGDQGEIQGIQKSGADVAQKQALTSEVPGEIAKNSALTREANARADELDNAPAPAGPDLSHAYGTAAQKAIAEGRDPMTDPVVQHLSDAITNIQKQAAPKELSAENDLKNQIEAANQKGDTATVGKLKKQLADLNPLGQQHVSISLAGLDKRDQDKGDKADVAARGAAFKAYTPAMDSAERFNVMSQNYEDAVKNHDQQAMLSLLANHLGMTMGLQKGARMTKDIVQEAQQSRPWLQGLQAKFDSNGVLSGVTLTKPQMQQMVGLGRDRYAQDISKARSEAQYMGAKDDGPTRIPSKSTINFYMGQAGGDPNKAKQLAAEDGWTIQ